MRVNSETFSLYSILILEIILEKALGDYERNEIKKAAIEGLAIK